jgi:two-component system, OmpR family, sensor histidine kinase VicK
MRLPHSLVGMRSWLGLAFAAVAGFTAVGVVIVFDARAERAFRTHAREYAVGNAIAASEALKEATTLGDLRSDAIAISGSRNLAIFVFDGNGRLLTAPISDGIRWSDVPDGQGAMKAPLTEGQGRFISGLADGSEFVVGVGVYAGPGRVLVAYSRRPEVQDQLSFVRHEFLQSAIAAFIGGAALGLLIATLTARRLARIARAAKAIGEGDFTAETTDRFPDEVGGLALSIDSMRVQLRELFGRLGHERDRLESLLDRLSDGVLLIDADLNVEFANGRARDLLGIADRLDCPERLGPKQAADLGEFARRLFVSRRPAELQLSEPQLLVVSGIPPASGGENAIIVVADESERERNTRIQREFATNAAHELRTPLASIVAAVELLRTGAKDDPNARDRFLDVIARESDRLTRLSRALLVLARADAREQQPRLARVAVRPILSEVADSLPRRDGLEIGMDCPASLAVIGDSDLLEQAVSSVAANAVQYTPAGSVRIRGRAENGSVVIEVADTGRGIAPRERARIFDRFQRAGGPGEGFGLGLAIARDAVRTLGGDIEVDSAIRRGTTVRIRLPSAPKKGAK